MFAQAAPASNPAGGDPADDLGRSRGNYDADGAGPGRRSADWLQLCGKCCRLHPSELHPRGRVGGVADAHRLAGTGVEETGVAVVRSRALS